VCGTTDVDDFTCLSCAAEGSIVEPAASADSGDGDDASGDAPFTVFALTKGKTSTRVGARRGRGQGRGGGNRLGRTLGSITMGGGRGAGSQFTLPGGPLGGLDKDSIEPLLRSDPRVASFAITAAAAAPATPAPPASAAAPPTPATVQPAARPLDPQPGARVKRGDSWRADVHENQVGAMCWTSVDLSSVVVTVPRSPSSDNFAPL
jgi:hypothetical protein